MEETTSSNINDNEISIFIKEVDVDYLAIKVKNQIGIQITFWSGELDFDVACISVSLVYPQQQLVMNIR